MEWKSGKVTFSDCKSDFCSEKVEKWLFQNEKVFFMEWKSGKVTFSEWKSGFSLVVSEWFFSSRGAVFLILWSDRFKTNYTKIVKRAQGYLAQEKSFRFFEWSEKVIISEWKSDYYGVK